MITHVVEWFVRAALMALGTAAVLRLLRIRGAVACHMAWTVVLAFMLLMPVWTAWGPKVAMPVVPEAGLSTFDPILPENISLQPLAATATPSVAAPQPLSAPASPEPPSGWPWLWIALGCYAPSPQRCWRGWRQAPCARGRLSAEPPPTMGFSQASTARFR